ncbi:hypothetical protein AAHA92_09227 [Salvia divinorum]|uniref:Uncharacterized protein n=1 Tax=Salvia divinorum TaxID=28513 RepID=A0ABD1HS73_SALDI
MADGRWASFVPNNGHNKQPKTEKSCRLWSVREEDNLRLSLKELVALGWKSDNRSGVGFNNKGDYMIDCDDDQWEQVVEVDANARLMRNKPWPFWEDWKIIFEKDRANDTDAKDILEAVNELNTQENNQNVHEVGDYNKRKSDGSMDAIFELMSKMHNDANAKLEGLSNRIGYEVDLSKARKDVYAILGRLPSLSIEEKFEVSETLVGKPNCLDLFMGLPDSDRPAYVSWTLKSNRKSKK